MCVSHYVQETEVLLQEQCQPCRGDDSNAVEAFLQLDTQGLILQALNERSAQLQAYAQRTLGSVAVVPQRFAELSLRELRCEAAAKVRKLIHCKTDHRLLQIES